ncbi:Fe-only nitrogenase accessory protein AnfO [Azomonas agilis]|uniref:Fe-only nitrogenase accessory protein AnfO n=1 Tax=Azomonas agilis TaxID=116849 RepID=A0A562IYZ5_9GAMM|nr:Fe-only nitrogenase accessory protein AnfO [Azomonas agilis]TWH75804.1 Fe-only nitrogenase accessory protein AnfO [Azomonas agilis]
MKIAVCVDSNGNMAGLYAGASLHLYEREQEALWQLTRQVPINISAEMDIAAVKNVLYTAVAELEGCKILLSTEVRGLLYSILQEEMGFTTWKSKGDLQEQLNQVAQNDPSWVKQLAEAAAEAKRLAEEALASCCGGGGVGGRKKRSSSCSDNATQLPQPECVAEGLYRFDLEGTLAKHEHFNSQQLLIPFLENTRFQELEVLCGHVPRWLNKKLEELSLVAEFEELNGSRAALKIRILPKEVAEAAH